MTTQNNQFANVNNTFDLFANNAIDPQQLTYIKGGEDLDGDGIDDETQGVVGTEDVVGF